MYYLEKKNNLYKNQNSKFINQKSLIYADEVAGTNYILQYKANHKLSQSIQQNHKSPHVCSSPKTESRNTAPTVYNICLAKIINAAIL